MRAYLIGYHHGIIDGTMDDFIEQGKFEAMRDESLEVEYMTIEQMLEIIDEVKSDANKGYMFDMVDEIKNRVSALKEIKK